MLSSLCFVPACRQELVIFLLPDHFFATVLRVVPSDTRILLVLFSLCSLASPQTQGGRHSARRPALLDAARRDQGRARVSAARTHVGFALQQPVCRRRRELLVLVLLFLVLHESRHSRSCCCFCEFIYFSSRSVFYRQYRVIFFLLSPQYLCSLLSRIIYICCCHSLS